MTPDHLRQHPGARRTDANPSWTCPIRGKAEPSAFLHEKIAQLVTQAELAAQLFCSDSLISSIETGQAPATETFAEAADKILNTRGALHEQLRYLVEVGETENISVRIVPSRLHRGVRGPFAIATLENGAQVAQTETAFGGVVSTRAEDVATVTASWEAISSASLPEDMSRDMIVRTAEELWKQS